jgi:t-SNARE complex subunit (syntaxin)
MERKATLKKEQYEQLEQDVLMLQDSMNILHELVHSQQESIDTLEEYIEESKINTSHALKEIKEAKEVSTWYDYTKYIAGGIVGAVIYILL